MITLGSIGPLFTIPLLQLGAGDTDTDAFSPVALLPLMPAFKTEMGKEVVELANGDGDKELLLLRGGGVVGDLMPSL